MYALSLSSPAQRRRGGVALLLAALAVWVLSSCGLLALSQAQTAPLKDINASGSYFESVAGPCSISLFTRALCALLLGSSTMAKTLYVGSNNGQIFSFSLTGSTLTQISSTNDSFPAPSWQTISGDYLYSVSETGGTTPGTITAYTITDGIFKKISSDVGLPGPVNIAVASGGKLLITAGYGGHGINTFSANYGVIKKTSTFTFTDTSIDPDRQTASYPHQVAVDPTGNFAVVPDLGADFLRVYLIKNGGLQFLQNVPAKPGSGPRHGVFWPKKDGVKPTHFFLASELASTITAYKLTYAADNSNLLFSATANSAVYDTFNRPLPPPAVAVKPAAGEIDISPDNKFLYVSNRLDQTYPGPPPSDSMSSWTINPDGTLKFIGLTPSGGLAPRHFSLATLDGKDYVTVANPTSGDLAIFTRDTATGKLGTVPFAAIKVPGAACAFWKI